MTSSDSGTWNPESFDRGLTECGTCGTRTTGGVGIDPSSLRALVHDEIRRYLASASPDAAEPVSPVGEGDGSGGEECEAPGRSEGLDVEAIEHAAVMGWLSTATARDLIAEIRRLESEVDARARSVIAANGRTERVEAALVRIRGERDSAVISADQWKADAIRADKDRDHLRKFLDETVRERDEARTALAVAKAQAESEAVARAEAEAERDALPEKIGDEIRASWERRPKGYGTGLQALAWQDAEGVARSFGPPVEYPGAKALRDLLASPAEPEPVTTTLDRDVYELAAERVAHLIEPVPEPVREWGVRHGDDCKLVRPGRVTVYDSEDRARNAGPAKCSADLVSRVPGGEWEAAD